MRDLPFVVQPGIGPGQFPRRGSLADLALALPYVVIDEIPPRRVLNDVLRRGGLDAGMSGGCLWEPFEIDDAEYEQLVHELQHRGTRPIAGRDAGGKPFRLSDPPASVRTYPQWSAYRYEQRLGTPSPLADGEAEASASTDYDEWLDRLPVADLYLDYLGALKSDWRKLPDDALELPAELVSKLRELAQLIDKWLYKRSGGASTYHAWLRDHSTQTERLRSDARACVDRLGLPRWPYKRFSIPAR